MVTRRPVSLPLGLLQGEDVKDRVLGVHGVGEKMRPEGFADDGLEGLPLGVRTPTEEIVLALRDLGLDEGHDLWIMNRGV